MRKVPHKKHQKRGVFHCFSGSGSFHQIRGPGVGALAGIVRNGQEQKRGSSRTLFSHPGTLNTWVFPELFPQRDSSYNTMTFRAGSRLDRKSREEPAGMVLWRPKD